MLLLVVVGAGGPATRVALSVGVLLVVWVMG
jgi:hypothetical protein